MSRRHWPDLAGEISGAGSQPGRGAEYEAACRRMVLAAADWLEDHPGIVVDWSEFRPRVPGLPEEKVAVIANWEHAIRTDNAPTRALCAVMHAACCDGRGDKAGPTYLMMATALHHARYIQRAGWDAYIATMAARRDGGEGIA